MERRCQEVIDACWRMEDFNPIVSVHDVGAGGVSNAMPELVNDHELGAILDLRKIPSLEPGMSPMEIWSNEAQERYVLAIRPSSLELFESLCT
jgi:phosphoribosylformylglycinamidine synthase